jgi:hypothetical protein
MAVVAAEQQHHDEHHCGDQRADPRYPRQEPPTSWAIRLRSLHWRTAFALLLSTYLMASVPSEKARRRSPYRTLGPGFVPAGILVAGNGAERGICCLTEA